MTPFAAAELLRLDYREPAKLNTLARLDIGGVQARIVGQGEENSPALIISGSNARSDFHLFNFRWWPLPHVTEGDTRRWHRGFFRAGSLCYSFAKGWLSAGGALDFVAGHSLGAAAAQIVGSSLAIPTYGFAAPKPLWGAFRPVGAEHVLLWCDRSDLVCKAPPVGFSHVGRVTWFDSGSSLEDRLRAKPHPIERYLAHL